MDLDLDDLDLSSNDNEQSSFLPADLLMRLLEICGLDDEAMQEWRIDLGDMDEIIHAKNPDDSLRKKQRNINKRFWDLFYNVLEKLLKEQGSPLCTAEDPAFYLLTYGILNPAFFEAESLDLIGRHASGFQPSLTIIPLYRWLELIYRGEEFPSITELGIDWPKHEREENRRRSQKDRAAYEEMPVSDKALVRVNHELKNMVTTVSRMSVSGFSQGLYVQHERNVMDPKFSLITIQKIQKLIQEIRYLDYTIFYKDALYKTSATSNDIVKVEVLPYIILLPLSGDKVTYWQDQSGTKKTTRGRLMIPIFFTGNLRDSFIKAMGNYRWESCRNAKGNHWSDPVEGGITGAFYDYCTFFKKNTKMTLEAKAKLKKTMSNYRKNIKNVFLMYYQQWINYESRGIMKMDKVARELFFKNLPFRSEIRQRLRKLPAYMEMVTKIENINNQEITRLDRKFKKFQNDDGSLPNYLQSTINYHTL